MVTPRRKPHVYHSFCGFKLFLIFLYYATTQSDDSKRIAMGQWCQFTLSIGGNNLQFYPNFALFCEHWGDEARPLFFSRESNMTNVQHAFEQIK